MYSNPRGHVYIIDNEDFDFHSKRNGSDVDSTSLKILFSELGFQVNKQGFTLFWASDPSSG